MRGRLAVYFAVSAVIGCSAFVSLDGLFVPDGGIPPEAGADDATRDDGGADGGDTGIDTHVPACPSGRGSAMIEFDGIQCIDAVETSIKDYLEFLAEMDGGLAKALPGECTFKADHVPNNVANNVALPVVWTDWCDAWAYCKWAGKEMCGSPDGGPIVYGDIGDWTKSVWMAACSHDGTQQFPYGNNFQKNNCQLTDPDGGAGSFAVVSGTNKKCEGGFPGIYEMIGNVREWENACDGTSGAPDNCRRRGGAYNESDQSYVKCSYEEDYTRDFRSATSGFRCCARKQ